MKKAIVIIAILLFSVISFALPTGKQYKGITILAGIVSYADGSRDYSIVAYTVKEGRFLIKEIGFNKSVNIKLLSDTLLNQDGFTQDEIKKYGYAIDHKRRHVILKENSIQFKSAFCEPINWQFSKKITDAITLFIPEEIIPDKAEIKKQIAKAKKTEKKLNTKLEQLEANRKALKELLK